MEGKLKVQGGRRQALLRRGHGPFKGNVTEHGDCTLEFCTYSLCAEKVGRSQGFPRSITQGRRHQEVVGICKGVFTIITKSMLRKGRHRGMVGGETMSQLQEIPYFFNSSELSILALTEL